MEIKISTSGALTQVTLEMTGTPAEAIEAPHISTAAGTNLEWYRNKVARQKQRILALEEQLTERQEVIWKEVARADAAEGASRAAVALCEEMKEWAARASARADAAEAKLERIRQLMPEGPDPTPLVSVRALKTVLDA